MNNKKEMENIEKTLQSLKLHNLLREKAGLIPLNTLAEKENESEIEKTAILLQGFNFYNELNDHDKIDCLANLQPISEYEYAEADLEMARGSDSKIGQCVVGFVDRHGNVKYI